MEQQVILFLDSDIVVRHPLAEHLRSCGYTVIEAANAGEVSDILILKEVQVDIMLASASDDANPDFSLAQWIREERPEIHVLLVGTVPGAAAKVGQLCAQSPKLGKPYNHQLVEKEIRRLLAKHRRK